MSNNSITPTPRLISLEQATLLLDNVYAILSPSRDLCTISAEKDQGSVSRSIFSRVYWTDREGRSYCCEFDRDDNVECRLCGCLLTLVDTDGYAITLTLLSLMDTETHLKK